MIVHDKPLSWYVDKIRNKEYFSQGMYGDGEWIAMFHEKIGGKNAEETVYTQELCDALEATLHFKAENFIFSAPAGLKNAEWSGIGEKVIDKFLEERGLSHLEFYEKDMWDLEMREGRALEFLKVLRENNVAIISNKALRGLEFLNYDAFFEVGYPNCFEDINRIVDEVTAYGKPGVYIVAMGLPASILVQRLHVILKESFILDLGSIWDAFVGIGAQRGWRGLLYSDPVAYQAWKDHYLLNLMIMEKHELWDRAAILKVRCEMGMGQEEELKTCLDEMGEDVNDELFKKLYDANKAIWDIEDVIGKLNKDIFNFIAAIGEKALRVREINTARSQIKNEVAKKFEEKTEVKKYG